MVEKTQQTTKLPRKVVLFHETLVNPGGAERLFIEEYKFLKRHGVQTHVLTFGPVDSRALYDTAMPELEVLQRRNILDGILKLRKRLVELEPDIVIVACGLRDLYLATRGTTVRYLLHQHEPPFKWFLDYKPILYSWFRRGAIEDIRRSSLYAYIDSPNFARSVRDGLRIELESILDALAIRSAWRITVLSNQSAREVRGLYGREAVVARGAVGQELLTGEIAYHHTPVLVVDGKKMILSISRLHKGKRLDIIIQAFAELIRHYPDVRLMIGGVGPEEGNLRKLTLDLGLGSQVIFCGYVPVEAVWAYYQACDVFVLADWTDFDITTYEALAFNRKVVGSAEMEIEPGILASGLVFLAKPTPQDYAEALRRALTSTEDTLPDLSPFTWESYFRCLLSCSEPSAALLLSTRPQTDPGAFGYVWNCRHTLQK